MEPENLGRVLLELFRRFLFRYKNNRTYRVSIPKRTDLCYSENRIADMTKIKTIRPRKSRNTTFPPKDGRKEHDYRLFCPFWTNRYSVNSVNYVYSHSGIVPKARAPFYAQQFHSRQESRNCNKTGMYHMGASTWDTLEVAFITRLNVQSLSTDHSLRHLTASFLTSLFLSSSESARAFVTLFL